MGVSGGETTARIIKGSLSGVIFERQGREKQGHGQRTARTGETDGRNRG